MDPLSGFIFHVFVGKTEFGFSRLSGLQREVEATTYQEGGLNDRVHVLPGPVKNHGTVRLERGAYAKEYFPFYLPGERLRDSVRIELRIPGDTKKIAKAYILSGVMVKKWEVGDLDALQNAILIDRFELSYEHLSVATS